LENNLNEHLKRDQNRVCLQDYLSLLNLFQSS